MSWKLITKKPKKKKKWEILKEPHKLKLKARQV